MVEHHRHHRRRHLHDERRDAERHDVEHQAKVGLATRQLQTERSAFREDEIPHHGNHAARLTCDGGPRAARDAPSEHCDEQQVEHDAHNRAEHHGDQRKRGLTRRAQEVVHAHAKRLEAEENADDLDELLRRLIEIGRGADEREHRVDEHESGKGDGGGHDEQEHRRVSHGLLNQPDLALAELDGGEGVAALPREHGEAHENGHDGQRERGDRDAHLADEPAEHRRIHHVIECVEHHRYDGGDGELEQQLADPLGPHAIGARLPRAGGTRLPGPRILGLRCRLLMPLRLLKLRFLRIQVLRRTRRPRAFDGQGCFFLQTNTNAFKCLLFLSRRSLALEHIS